MVLHELIRVRARFFILLLCALAFLSGCTLPRIIILNDPLSAEEHDKLGRIYESQGKEDLALVQYRSAVKKDSGHAPSWLLLGDLSYKRGDCSEAESAYKKALALQPENGDIYNNLSWVYLGENKKTAKAEELVREAIKRTPDHRPFYLDTLGVVLLRQGRVEESIAALKESLDTLPKDKPPYLAEAYTHLSEAYRAAGDALHADEAAAAAKKYAIIGD